MLLRVTKSRAEKFHCAGVGRWAGPASWFSPPGTNRRGWPMRAGWAAPLLWQNDGFSCRDAHAFNRISSSQVTDCVRSSEFPHVSYEISVRNSPTFPSFHASPSLVLLPFIAGLQPAPLPDLHLRLHAYIDHVRRLAS